MLTIFNTIIGVILTGILGSYLTNKITFLFQNRSNINNIKIKKAEEQIKAISDLSLYIHKSSSSRRFAMLNLINALADDVCNLDEIRQEYRSEVKKWNIDLGSYNIELNALGFFNLARDRLENKVHENFVMAHNCLNSYIINKDKGVKKSDPKQLEKSNEFLNNVVKETNNICFELIQESDRVWDDLKNDKSIPMSIDNLHRAETWKLIFAIFYGPRSNPLRVKSSSPD